jgi:cytochrome c5
MKALRNALAVTILGAAALAFAGSEAKSTKPASSGSAISAAEPDSQWMIEGEKRYRANCGRCHQAPHKFSPRAMATAIRHMQVRAMLTDEDVKYITYYMTR